MRMSKKGFLFVGSILLTTFLGEFVLAQAGGQQQPAAQKPAAQKPAAQKPKETTTPSKNTKNEGDSGSTLVDELLNDFEEAEDWRALSTTPLGETKIKKTVQIGPIQDTYNPNNLTPEEKEMFKSGQNHVLGVKTYFKEKGFDRVVVKPPHEYVIRGIGRQVDIWALGRQFRHTLFVVLRDYKGRIHKLKLGRLDYLGWRKLSATIPGWLPQSQRFALLDKNLHFVSLYVQSDAKEIGGDFYFYVDNISMKIDKTDTDYPGSMIKDTW